MEANTVVPRREIRSTLDGDGGDNEQASATSPGHNQSQPTSGVDSDNTMTGCVG
jgi:hypothetical protein